MLPKDNKYDRPLYYTRYIGLTCIERIQVYSGSALSIIPKRLLYFFGIPLYRLSATTTKIYSFNAGSSHPLGKIRLCCRIGDLKSEVTVWYGEDPRALALQRWLRRGFQRSRLGAAALAETRVSTHAPWCCSAG